MHRADISSLVNWKLTVDNIFYHSFCSASDNQAKLIRYMTVCMSGNTYVYYVVQQKWNHASNVVESSDIQWLHLLESVSIVVDLLTAG